MTEMKQYKQISKNTPCHPGATCYFGFVKTNVYRLKKKHQKTQTHHTQKKRKPKQKHSFKTSLTTYSATPHTPLRLGTFEKVISCSKKGKGTHCHQSRKSLQTHLPPSSANYQHQVQVINTTPATQQLRAQV